MEDFFITLKNDLYISNTISNAELVTFALIQKNYNTAKEVSLCSVNLLLDYMYIKHTNSKIAKDVKDSIKGLLIKDYITIVDLHYKEVDFNGLSNADLFYVCLDRFEDNYFKILERDLDIIFSYLTTTNIDKFAFTRYFIAIQRVISCSTSFGFLTQKKVRDLVGEGKTVSNYNRILQDEVCLIRYNNNYVTPEKEYCSTYFGRYQDVANFTKQLDIEIKEKRLVFSNKTKTNVKRSTKQKINRTEKDLVVANKDDKIRELEEELSRLREGYGKLEIKGNTAPICSKIGFTDINGQSVIDKKKIEEQMAKDYEKQPEIFGEFTDTYEEDEDYNQFKRDNYALIGYPQYYELIES